MAVTDQERYQSTVVTLISLVLSFYGSFRYLIFGTKHFDENDPFDVGLTPFTANTFVIFVFWAILYVLQGIFVLQYLYPDNGERSNVGSIVGKHFTIFNLLTFFWSLLFAKGHYFLSELLVVVNFFNIIILYFVHGTFTVKGFQNYLLVHIPTASLPFSWLLYLLFWNGAVLFRAQSGFVARILANIFVWNFLIIPMGFLMFFSDWGVGFSSSFLMLGLALDQLFTKVFALQWIFAFIISGILCFFSLLTVSGVSVGVKRLNADGEREPLISGSEAAN